MSRIIADIFSCSWLRFLQLPHPGQVLFLLLCLQNFQMGLSLSSCQDRRRGHRSGEVELGQEEGCEEKKGEDGSGGRC